MSAEEQIKQQLISRFGLAEEKVRIPRRRRIFLELAAGDFEPVFDFAKNELAFNHLISITGQDEREMLSLVYHLAQDSGIVLNIKISVDKARPAVRTVTGYFPGAEIYERELEDLFGIRVEGLPEGSRYPLTDDWPAGQYPLRKDWKKTSGAGGTDEPAA